VVLGPAAGGAAYGPALTDIVICGPRARVFVTGPNIVRQVTGEIVDADALGGPDLHARRSGVVHLAERTDEDALLRARDLALLFAARVTTPQAALTDDRTLEEILPASSRSAYDMRILIRRLLDAESQVELHPRWALNVVTTIGRLGGRTVGVLANNPWHLAGCLDCSGSEKAAAFVSTCDTHCVPLIVLVDVPGYLPGSDQESGGIVMRGARLLAAFSRARVPRVTVIVRKAYGGAFIAMNSRALGATAVYAWPNAEVGVMYPTTAAEILHRRLLAHTSPSRRSRRLDALAHDYLQLSGGLDRALREGHVDRVIEPASTRRTVALALDSASTEQGISAEDASWLSLRQNGSYSRSVTTSAER
jgi:acetyl-CoA/propionyl-CoA carboxylase carboxyl transferase subunit